LLIRLCCCRTQKPGPKSCFKTAEKMEENTENDQLSDAEDDMEN